MCNLLNDINILVGASKLKEAITKLETECQGTLVKFSSTITSLKLRYSDFDINETSNMLTNDQIKAERAIIGDKAINIATKMCEFSIDEIDLDAHLNKVLVMRDSFPFIDRTNFRKEIKKAMLSKEPKILFVEGPSKSGMSYLEIFLEDLTNQVKLYSLESLHIPKALYGADIVPGEVLAKSILNKIGLKDVEFDQRENEQFKFNQFVNKLKEKLNKEEKIPLFFLHDFHQIEEDNNNLLEFIFAIIKEIGDDFPKCIFIIAGLNYRNIRDWKSKLRFVPTTKVYTIESIDTNHIKNCLSLIFDKYEGKIHKFYEAKSIDEEEIYEDMSKEEYVEGFLGAILKESQDIDITEVGVAISDHLLDIKEQ